MGNFLSSCNKKSDIEQKLALSLQQKLNNNFMNDDLCSVSENDTLYWNTEEYDGRYLNVSLEELGKLYLQGSLPCNKNNLTINDIVLAYKSNPFVQSNNDFQISYNDDIFVQTDNCKFKNKSNCSNKILFGGNNDFSEFNIVNNKNDIKSDTCSPTSSDTAYLHYERYKKTNTHNNQTGGNNFNNDKYNNTNSNIGGNSNNDLLKNTIYENDIFSKYQNDSNKIYNNKNNNKNESMSHSELSDLKRFIRNQQNNISESSDNSNTVSTIEHLLKSTVTDNSDDLSQSEQSSESNKQYGGSKNRIPFFSTESMDVSYGF